MRVDELFDLDISSMGLTHEEVVAVWQRLWRQQQQYPQITEGVKDDDVEIIIRERGWTTKVDKTFGSHSPEKLDGDCGIGVYWIFDNLEYGNWVSINPDTRIVQLNPQPFDGQVSTFIPLDEFINPTTKE